MKRAILAFALVICTLLLTIGCSSPETPSVKPGTTVGGTGEPDGTTAPVTTAPVTTAPVTDAPTTTVPVTDAPAQPAKAMQVYTVTGDPYVYVLFDKAAELESDATLHLVGYGWPTGEGDLRYMSRVPATLVESADDSGRLWKFAFLVNGSPSADHVNWGFRGGCAANEGPIAVTPHGGHWLYVLSGSVKVGGETLTQDVDTLCDGNGVALGYGGHTVARLDEIDATKEVSSVGAIPVN